MGLALRPHLPELELLRKCTADCDEALRVHSDCLRAYVLKGAFPWPAVHSRRLASLLFSCVLAACAGDALAARQKHSDATRVWQAGLATSSRGCATTTAYHAALLQRLGTSSQPATAVGLGPQPSVRTEAAATPLPASAPAPPPVPEVAPVSAVSPPPGLSTTPLPARTSASRAAPVVAAGPLQAAEQYVPSQRAAAAAVAAAANDSAAELPAASHLSAVMMSGLNCVNTGLYAKVSVDYRCEACVAIGCGVLSNSVPCASNPAFANSTRSFPLLALHFCSAWSSSTVFPLIQLHA